MRNKIVLLLCGSFNPITNMHLRMFELAKDHFRDSKIFELVGGIISPVSDHYEKKGLQSGKDRCKMVYHAIENDPFIIMDNWESSQSDWIRTRYVLETIQKRITNDLFDDYQNHDPENKIAKIHNKIQTKKWIETINFSDKITVKLLCGADLVESFSVPGLWDPNDINYILGNHGLVVINRGNFDSQKYIYEHDLLYQSKNNIELVPNWVASDISSTKIRRSLSRNQSVKYLIPDIVIEYIKEHNLYKETSQINSIIN